MPVYGAQHRLRLYATALGRQRTLVRRLPEKRTGVPRLRPPASAATALLPPHQNAGGASGVHAGADWQPTPAPDEQWRALVAPAAGVALVARQAATPTPPPAGWLSPRGATTFIPLPIEGLVQCC